jgi:hypothetical protein
MVGAPRVAPESWNTDQLAHFFSIGDDYTVIVMKICLPIEECRKQLSYDPETGQFDGRSPYKVIKKNKTYLKVYILGKRVYAHRLAYALHTGEWPKGEIDHINGDSTDNRFCNLRDVDRLENCRNVGLQPGSRSGIMGVNWHEKGKKWRARVKSGGKEFYLGLFDSKGAAESAVIAKREELGFHDNHGSKYNLTEK